MPKSSKQKNNISPGVLNKFIETKIKPFIQLDGGDIEFISYDRSTGQVKVRLMGACVGCPLSSITLKMGVQKQLQNKFVEITEVIMVD
jgi:Fe-S cluster biogenesis protein NfuA